MLISVYWRYIEYTLLGNKSVTNSNRNISKICETLFQYSSNNGGVTCNKRGGPDS